MEQSSFEKLIVTQIVKIFPAVLVVALYCHLKFLSVV